MLENCRIKTGISIFWLIEWIFDFNMMGLSISKHSHPHPLDPHHQFRQFSPAGPAQSWRSSSAVRRQCGPTQTQSHSVSVWRRLGQSVWTIGGVAHTLHTAMHTPSPMLLSYSCATTRFNAIFWDDKNVLDIEHVLLGQKCHFTDIKYKFIT